MSDRILLVDDDPNLLAAAGRHLRRQFQLDTAEGGEQGLAKIAECGPYAVVVSDRQMPGMDGITFLAQVRERAPDTVRIMLTGNADLESAIRVVNEGNIFRFLTKPSSPELLSKAIEDGLNQYRLVTAEKDLLSKTLGGSIKLLTDILSMVDPLSFGRAQVLREAITAIGESLHISNAWEIHLAVMLAPLGCVTVPPELILRSRTNRETLSETESQMLLRVPETTATLLANVPRLEGVARIVRYQNKRFDGSGYPQDALFGDQLPLGSRLLKILLDMMEIQVRGRTRRAALNELQTRRGWYDPVLLSAVRNCLGARSDADSTATIPVRVKDLVTGMFLRSNVEALDGTLILSSGHLVNGMVLERIQNFELLGGIKEPILVENPAPAAPSS